MAHPRMFDDDPYLARVRTLAVPAYLGPSGWLGVDLDEHTDWTETAELLDASFRATAPKRAIDELDARDDAP